MTLPPVAFIDLLTTDRAPVRTYNAIRVRQTLDWLATLGGDAPRLAEVIARGNALRASLGRVRALTMNMSASERYCSAPDEPGAASYFAAASLRNLRLSTDAAVTSAVASTPGRFSLITLAMPPPYG